VVGFYHSLIKSNQDKIIAAFHNRELNVVDYTHLMMALYCVEVQTGDKIIASNEVL
jgi:hypothetical protein